MYLRLKLQTLPEMGFAHHFYAENYRQEYGIQDNSFELVYIQSGNMRISMGEVVEDVPQGSLFLLCRELPLCFETMDNTPHSHTSIQLRGSFSLSLFNEIPERAEQMTGLLLPMIVPPCEKTKKIGQLMNGVVARLQHSRLANAQSSAAAMLGILAELDAACRDQSSKAVPSDVLLADKLSAWIDTHLREDISLERLAAIAGRSPNYVNAIFKRVNGVPVRQYVNRRKAVLMAELLAYKNADFRTACDNVGISDVAYGYRLFKKQLGTTPQQYVSAVYTQTTDEH